MPCRPFAGKLSCWVAQENDASRWVTPSGSPCPKLWLVCKVPRNLEPDLTATMSLPRVWQPNAAVAVSVSCPPSPLPSQQPSSPADRRLSVRSWRDLIMAVSQRSGQADSAEHSGDPFVRLFTGGRSKQIEDCLSHTISFPAVIRIQNCKYVQSESG